MNRHNRTDSSDDNRSSSHGRDNPVPPSAEKDPADWVTGDESMTGPQASYLRTLAQEAGEEVDDSLTKAEASQKIEELQERTGRGRDH